MKPEDDPMWHEPHHIEGFTQCGTIANGGYKYAVWGAQFEGLTASIVRGRESGRYWARLGNCYYGDHKTPERAAAVIRAELQTGEGET